jgi:hypothetical protein
MNKAVFGACYSDFSVDRAAIYLEFILTWQLCELGKAFESGRGR